MSSLKSHLSRRTERQQPRVIEHGHPAISLQYIEEVFVGPAPNIEMVDRCSYV
jgi:hypothetical protein